MTIERAIEIEYTLFKDPNTVFIMGIVIIFLCCIYTVVKHFKQK